MQDNQKPPTLSWYNEGLRFKCTECGMCCTGSPGYVWVDEGEMVNMADHLKISVADFKRQYTRQIKNQYALLEKPRENFDCIFLKEKKCSIYPVRPKQCRTFPWWKENLRSKESWEAAKSYCEGISDTAPLISFKEISSRLHSSESN